MVGSRPFLAIHLPDFRLIRAGLDPAGPVLLHRFERSAERVVVASQSCQKMGISVGMSLAEARALLPELKALPLGSEDRDLEELGEHLRRFTPSVRVLPPEDLLLEDAPLLELRLQLARLGQPARLVRAQQPRVALLLARCLPADQEVEDPLPILQALPIQVLCNLPPLEKDDLALEKLPAFAEALQDVGIRSLGQLAALPYASVAGRFGASAGRLWLLASARMEPPKAVLLPPQPAELPPLRQLFDDPVEQAGSLLFVLRALVAELCAFLIERDQVLLRLDLCLELEDGSLVQRPLRPSWPTRRQDVLLRLGRSSLEGIVLSSPVLALELQPGGLAPFRPTGVGLWERAEAAESLPVLLSRLQEVLGIDAVGQNTVQDRWLPEESWKLLPVGETEPPPPEIRWDPALPHRLAEGPRPRPEWLLPEAEAMRVLVAPSGRPRAWMQGGKWQAFGRVEGPERLKGGWWEERWERDYWTVEVPGAGASRHAWLFRTGDRWFLHGWWERPLPMPEAEELPPIPDPLVYAELICRSSFSFTEGASSPEELVQEAKRLGLVGMALTDRDGVYGAVRFHKACKEQGIKGVQGALLTLRLSEQRVDEGGASASLVILVMDRQGWANLCRLISAARAESPKGRGELPFPKLLERHSGLVLLARGDWPEEFLSQLQRLVGDRLYRAVSRHYAPEEEDRVAALVAGDIPVVAVGDVLFHREERQPLQDVLTAIRLATRVDNLGTRVGASAERALPDARKMLRRFRRWPELIPRSSEILDRCTFTLDELRYSYPREVVPRGYSPQAWLRELCARNLAIIYVNDIKAWKKVGAQVEHELGVIAQLDFASYFLTIQDLVQFARKKGILCQGRGSAANSAVCFVLGITPVDPATSSLLFERFISPERAEPPDIDVDFEHERREEVIQYVYEKYGRDRAGMVNEVICWRGRMAVRDVGRALGLGLDQIDRLAKNLDHWGIEPPSPERLREAGLDPSDPRLLLLHERTRDIHSFPRHTSIHVGGFVIADEPLIDRVPIEPATMEGRTVIQWDKDDVDAVGFVKVDVLALGMLTAIRKAFNLIQQSQGPSYTLANIPREDPAVYDMLCRADTVGVFQVESRAQQSMLPRLKPRTFYDLVVEVSIVRPGPIQGGMVHPYLRRRSGQEETIYEDERLRPILARTMGVPIFQEQVMAMAVAVGGFTPGEADALRRAMGSWRRRGGMDELGHRLMAGMEKNGIRREYAERIFSQIQGFAEYGFPESHATAFAHLVYVSSWLHYYYPAAFCAALLNAQPMGFYSSRALIDDVARHGVRVLPVDISHSGWDNDLEWHGKELCLRLGFREIKGLREEDGKCIEVMRKEKRFESISELASRSGLPNSVLRRLARAGALRGLEPDRRSATWTVDGLWPGLFAGQEREEQVALPLSTPLEELQADYRAMGLSAPDGSGKHHPLGHCRERLRREKVKSIADLAACRAGQRVVVAGLIASRQRPQTASGVLFLGLEDETGMLNVVVWPSLYARQRHLIRSRSLVRIRGLLQKQDGAISLVAADVQPFELDEQDFTVPGRDFH